MRFLVDAQLPRHLARRLTAVGHDSRHTGDLLAGNRTPDADLIAVADREERIVVTKDDDFVAAHVAFDRPYRLLLVSTGNIANHDLEALILGSLGDIETAFREARFVEISRDTLIVHR